MFWSERQELAVNEENYIARKLIISTLHQILGLSNKRVWNGRHIEMRRTDVKSIQHFSLKP
jgi:hypothetical protein